MHFVQKLSILQKKHHHFFELFKLDNVLLKTADKCIYSRGFGERDRHAIWM